MNCGKRIAPWTVALFVVFLLGIGVGWELGCHTSSVKNTTGRGKEERLRGGYRLINPLLECEFAGDTLRERELQPFKDKVKSFIKTSLDSGRARSISVYYRDLDSGETFNIGGNDGYAPASLSKLPVMIALLKKAEQDPQFLRKRVAFNGDKDWTAEQNIKPLKTIARGKSYSIEELINYMMAYSDNNAWSLLFQQLDVPTLDRVMADLGVDYQRVGDDELVTVKSYGRFLRILYNASFLSKEMSEKALTYLLADDFPQGLTAGVPKGMPVASKFGERTSGVNNEDKQLHDFGIIYYPGRPYLLCVMTRGDDFATLTDVIRDISKLVYEEVDKQVTSHRY